MTVLSPEKNPPFSCSTRPAPITGSAVFKTGEPSSHALARKDGEPMQLIEVYEQSPPFFFFFFRYLQLMQCSQGHLATCSQWQPTATTSNQQPANR